MQHVVGPLDPRASPQTRATATPAASGSRSGGSRRTRLISSAVPGGADQVRPWRPRPADCSAAVTSVPCGAPACASARARSLVDAVARRCRCGVPSALKRTGLIRTSSSRPESEQLGGRAAVHGERERPVGVLVDQRLAGRHVGERLRVDAARAVDGHRVAEPQPERRELLVLDVEHDVAEAVDADGVRDDLVGLGARERHVERHEVVGVDRLARRRERRAGGERGGDRREDVAAVEGRRRGLQAVRREPDVDRLDRAAEARDGEREQPVVRPDEHAVLLGDAHRDGEALAADLGVDDGEVDARRAVRQRAAQRRARRSARRGAGCRG